MSNNASADTYEIKASDSDSITEVAVSGLIDSDEDSIRKRSRAYSIESTASDRKVMRGNYRCSRCNKPKKGHKCNRVTQLRKRHETISLSVTNRTVDRYVDSQFDIVNYDSSITLVGLDLALQGYPSSYT